VTDDRTDLVKLVDEYAQALKDAYISLMDMETEITPSEASSMACTALISARDTLHPRYSSSNKGGSRGSGDKFDWDTWRKTAVDERDYTGGFWDNPPEDEGGMGSKRRLRYYNTCLLENYTGSKHNMAPDDAKHARYKFINGWFESKFGKPLPENYADGDTPLTKGESSYIMDKIEEKFPELFDKKEGK
jgi:hypothetical protein